MRKKAQIFVLILCVVGVIVALSSLDQGVAFANVSGVVEKVERDDDSLHFWVQNNPQAYVIYFSDLPEVVQIDVQKGDNVEFCVESEWLIVPENIVVHKLVVGGEQIFSTIDAHNTSARFVKGGFAFCLCILIILLLFFITSSDQAKPNTPQEFVIKNPVWALEFAYFFLAIGLAPTVYILALFLMGKINVEQLMAIIVFAFFVILALVLMYVCKHEYFAYKDGIYTYRKPFQREKSISVEQFSTVHVDIKGMMTVRFLEESGKTLYKFLDDGTSFKDGCFAQSLRENGKTLQVSVNGQIQVVDFDEQENDQQETL